MMSHRCINAFSYGNVIFPGGFLVADDAAILQTHAVHFAKVNEPVARATEVASAAPAEVRAVKKAAAKKVAPKPEPKPEPEPEDQKSTDPKPSDSKDDNK